MGTRHPVLLLPLIDLLKNRVAFNLADINSVTFLGESLLASHLLSLLFGSVESIHKLITLLSHFLQLSFQSRNLIFLLHHSEF